MGYLKITNLKTGKVYDSRGPSVQHLEGSYKNINGNLCFEKTDSYEPAYYGESEFDYDKFLSVKYDHLTGDEKTKAVEKEKYGK